jgi:hypothetical protein
MRTAQQLLALVLCIVVPATAFAVEKQTAYPVIYSGGSYPTVKAGEVLRLFIDQDQIRMFRQGGAWIGTGRNRKEPLIIKAASITELSYGQEVHRRVGTAVAVAMVSFGIGLLVALSKSKKHYIGVVWDAGDGKKGGLVIQADKDQYRGLIAALEGITGKKAVDTDSGKPNS